MDKWIINILINGSVFFSFLPLVIAFIRRKTLSRELRVLFFVPVFSVLADVSSKVLSVYSINNIFIFHIYTIVEFLLLSLVYHLAFSSKKLSLFILLATFVFLLIAVADITYFHSIKEMNVLSVICESIILMIYAGIYFYLFVQRLDYKDPLSNPMFWMNSAVLFYFSGCLFLFIFSNYVLKDPDNKLWIINNINNIIFNSLFCIAFWKSTNK